MMKYKVINGFPAYTIYEDGTILNHDRFVIMSWTKSRDKEVVRLTNNPKDRANFSKVVLLAEHFLPPKKEGQVVIHIDGDTKNHVLTNLKWGKMCEWNIKFDNEKDRRAAHLKSGRKCRNRRDKLGLVKPEQRKWRQTDKGHFTRNRNHWIEQGIREPEEGWETFWERVKMTTHCELCNVKFDPKVNYSSQRCVDHDHHSGYMRFICCRNCNISPLRLFDIRKTRVLFELHRFFNTR